MNECQVLLLASSSLPRLPIGLILLWIASAEQINWCEAISRSLKCEYSRVSRVLQPYYGFFGHVILKIVRHVTRKIVPPECLKIKAARSVCILILHTLRMAWKIRLGSGIRLRHFTSFAPTGRISTVSSSKAKKIVGISRHPKSRFQGVEFAVPRGGWIQS